MCGKKREAREGVYKPLALRVLLYCMALFAGMMVFIVVKEPYSIKEVGVDGNLVPDVELFNAHNFQIKEKNVDGVVHSRRVARYGAVDKLYDVKAEHKTKEGLKGTLVSDEAIVKGESVYFMANSHYKRDDGVALDGEEIEYHTKKNRLSSEKPFVFTQEKSRTTGSAFVYEMKEGTLSAENIHSVVETKKERITR